MNRFTIHIMIIIQGLKVMSDSRELPWPIYCQTISGEYCRIEVYERKLLCPLSCNYVKYREGNSQLIVDLESNSTNRQYSIIKRREHSRIKRETSSIDLFITTLFVQLTIFFIENSIR